jgi:hypothetical protein
VFHGPVRVPNEVGVGEAKVTLSFDTWKEAKVAPSTITILVREPEPDKR